MPTPLVMPNLSLDIPPLGAIEHAGTVVIVGANGTGKSRLGHWLEAHAAQDPGDRRFPVRRISANRLVQVPDAAQRVPVVQARNQVDWGHDTPPGASRVSGDPVVGVVNDVHFLVNALFAERDAQALTFMEAACDPTKPLERPTATVLDRVNPDYSPRD